MYNSDKILKICQKHKWIVTEMCYNKVVSLFKKSSDQVLFGSVVKRPTDSTTGLQVDRQILRVDRRVLRMDKRIDRWLLRVKKRVLRVEKRILRVEKRVLRAEKRVLRVNKRVLQVLQVVKWVLWVTRRVLQVLRVEDGFCDDNYPELFVLFNVRV